MKQYDIMRTLNVKVQSVCENRNDFINNIIQERTEFLKEYLKKTGLDGFVLGISGGVDSFVASMLARKAGVLISISLPYGDQKDIDDVISAVEIIDPDNFIQHNIKAAVDAQVISLLSSGYIPGEKLKLIKGNIMARERMSVQYSYASIYNYLVIGTDHATEAVVGFYTKYGDGACDIAPLAGLTKDIIYDMAKVMNAPKNILEKAPSAGLWDNQTDEDELGLKYSDIIDYLQGRSIQSDVKAKIESYYKKTEHKRQLPVTINDTWWK